MQLLEKVRETEFIGREFLLWLWFRSEKNEGHFSIGNGETAELYFDRRIVLQSEGDGGAEKIVCTGDNPQLKEARFALTEEKFITEAMIKLIIGDDEWSFVLDATWLNFKSFKSPKVVLDPDADPDGLFYEKYFLIEKAVSAVNDLFESFIRVRISADWTEKELPALTGWIKEGKPYPV